MILKEQLRYIEIKLPRCVVFLTATEINRLLQKDPDLFAEGLRRGKAIMRRRQELSRQSKARVPPELRPPT